MNLKPLVIGATLLAALILGGLAGVGVPASHGSAVPPAYAEDCDNYPPPPAVGPCRPTPTPTPPSG